MALSLRPSSFPALRAPIHCRYTLLRLALHVCRLMTLRNCQFLLSQGRKVTLFLPSAALPPAASRTLAEVIIATDMMEDPSLKLSNFTNRIVITPKLTDTVPQAVVNWISTVSKVATVVVIPYGDYDYGLGIAEYTLSRTVLATGQHCPFFAISSVSLDSLTKLLGNSTGTMVIDGSDGLSPVRIIFTSGWFMFLTIAMAITNIAVAYVAAVRLLNYFWATQNCRPQIATVCLWLELISAFLRFLYWGFDPFASRRIVPEFVKQASLRTINFPFTISCVFFRRVSRKIFDFTNRFDISSKGDDSSVILLARNTCGHVAQSEDEHFFLSISGVLCGRLHICRGVRLPAPFCHN